MALQFEPGDIPTLRQIPLGTINTRYPEAHPECVICGCDVTDFRVEFFGFVGVNKVELVMINTCRDHWHAPLNARLRALA